MLIKTSSVCYRLRSRAKRHIRASELNEIAAQMGKTKKLKDARSGMDCYMWSKEEIQEVIKILEI